MGDLPQSDTVTYQIKTKAPDKMKIISSDVTIIANGEKMSITEVGKDPVIFDSSTYAPATSTAQMNYFYNMDEFFDKHTVTTLGHAGNTFTLQAIPHEEEIYSKMILTVDYASGLELSCEIYDLDGELAYKTEMLNSEHIGEANVPIQSKETIYLEQGTIVKTATYTSTNITTGISDGEFEIGEE
jgi:outer membrane lipoprotein-sorting protein